ncbi:hypothetical protein Niako_1434 [Niastella koreensis GR20-10]|uniref:Uncharacterized protein n=2 Tax=Niastella koreensis TaxID=354356 RepID=G8TPI4_NIAKG|nr:hypothetical protein Niako_1434 [Niastella koreensis GR20-10]
MIAAIDSILGSNNITIPPYGVGKVDVLIEKIAVENPRSTDETRTLDPKLYDSLSLPEKFTYNMIHPETYMQICSILPMREDEDKRIYGHLPNTFGEYGWSERQLIFFIKNRDTVSQLMKPVIEKSSKVGGNIKEAIVKMNGTELIPYLIDFYNREKKDHYILTVLMLLMKENQYGAFVNSFYYSKLYEPKSGEYGAYLNYNKANEDLIIQRATNFYNGLHKI